MSTLMFTIWGTYLCVFVQYLLTLTSPYYYGLATTVTQFITGLFSFILLCKIINSSRQKDLFVIGLAIITFLLAAADLIYGSVVNVLMIEELRNSNAELFYNIPYALFWLASSLGFFFVIKKEPLKLQIVALGLAIMLLIIFTFIYAPVIYNENLTGLNRLIHATCMLNKILIVSVASLLLIFSFEKYILYYSAGFLTLISYSLLLEYLEITGQLRGGLPTEIFWTLGLVFFWYGARNIPKDQSLLMSGVTDLKSLRSKVFLLGFALQFLGIVGWIGFEKLWPAHFSIPDASKIVAWIIIVLLCFWAVSFYLKKRFVEPLLSLSGYLKNFGGDSEIATISEFGITEYDELLKGIYKKLNIIKDQQIRNVQISKLASEMSHDIRSPLTALKLLSAKNSDLPERSRLMMDQISSRIHNIADNLLKVKKGNMDTDEECIPYLILESILAEKKVSTSNKFQIEFVPMGDVYLKTIKVPKQKLSRILSNLINNSIDAFTLNPDISNPRISLFITNSSNKNFRITLQDNAGGIPEHILDAVKDGQSISTKASGNGIGLSQAREVIETANGRIDVISQLGYGTVVDIYLPISDSPGWLASTINIYGLNKAVIVDDDP